MDQREIDAITESLRRLKKDLSKMPLPASSREDAPAPTAPSKQTPNRSKPPAHK